MFTSKQAADVLGLSSMRVKQILREHSDFEIEKTDFNNGMIKINPRTMTKLLKLRDFEITHRRVIMKQQKGGVGGTSLSLLASMRLAQKGVRVLYIDLDSEANASSFLVEEGVELADLNSVLEIFKNAIRPQDCITRTRFQNIDIIPSKGLLRRADRLLSDKNPKLIIDKIISSVEVDYDIIFIDIPPTYTKLTESAYLAADLIILPYDQSQFSIEGVVLTYEDLQESIREFEVKRDIEIKVLMNKYSTITSASKEAFNHMAGLFSDKILPFKIKHSSDIVNCINLGKNLFETKSSPEVRESIDELCDFIAPIHSKGKIQ